METALARISHIVNLTYVSVSAYLLVSISAYLLVSISAYLLVSISAYLLLSISAYLLLSISAYLLLSVRSSPLPNVRFLHATSTASFPGPQVLSSCVNSHRVTWYLAQACATVPCLRVSDGGYPNLVRDMYLFLVIHIQCVTTEVLFAIALRYFLHNNISAGTNTSQPHFMD
ncbi:hypothetical protein GGS20DRAFT_234484 [Poronia punctata]|nr:hypothetical protein GGS20DRAFT_234484 [Poronia punctata]